MINIEEVFVANGIAILMMIFLLDCRQKNRESLHTDDKIYDGMAVTTLLGALFETITFLIDGKTFAGGRALNYIFNSLCFLGTVTIGFLWCLYVDLHIYRNHRRTMRNAKIVMLPWLSEVAAIVFNLFGTEFLFKISPDNVYQRCPFAIWGYITLMVYFGYSVFLVYDSKRQGFNLNFFPVLYFVGPCLAGVLLQLFRYGITTSWVSVAIAMTFVQMQAYSENLLTDELSGLYNRRYLDGILAKKDIMCRASSYGIMMDMNDFKRINDQLGHSAGDRAIRIMGDILFKSVPDKGMAIRYAGDEFVVLLSGVDHECLMRTMEEINKNIRAFNESGAEQFTLSVSMGQAQFKADDHTESFLKRMDESMYEEKRKYHLLTRKESKGES